MLHLLRRPVPVPALLVIAARPVGPAGRLLDAGAQRGRAGRSSSSTPLGREDAHAMVAGVADAAVRERVVLEGRGNPLFLRELARVADRGDGALPATLVAAIALEVAALGEVPRALIEGAAVAGDPFDPELAAAAAELDEAVALAALDELVAADLVRPVTSADDVPAPVGHQRGRRAARLPQAAAAGRRARGPARRDGTRVRLPAPARAAGGVRRRGARLAARRARAGRGRARAARRRAGRRARSTSCARPTSATPRRSRCCAAAAEATGESSPAAAAHWYAAALRLVPDSEHETRADLLARAAVALAGAGRLAEARAALLEALRAAAPSSSS